MAGETHGGEMLSVVQLGCGNVGRELLLQIASAAERYPWLRLCALGDSTGAWVAPGGFSPSGCRSLAAHKAARSSLDSWRPPQPASAGQSFLPAEEVYSPALVQMLEEAGLSRCAVVDVTGRRDLYPTALALRRAGHHLVFCNKWPLVVPHADYAALWQAGDGFLLHETTAGAALPVIRPLEHLVATGDRIDEVAACVSGTMGYVMSALQNGVPFSAAVREAARLGYTEPDPRTDLAGIDAQRKALILARKTGLPLDMEDIRVVSLVPPGLETVPLAGFWAGLPSIDGHYRREVEQAAREGKVLRYLARVRPGEPPTVGPERVDAGSPFASTRGTESLFLFRTTRYDQQPLVIRGQGAGGALTASGVLADILSIRASQAVRF